MAFLAFFKALDIKSWIIIALAITIAGLMATVAYKNFKIRSLNNDVVAAVLATKIEKQNVVTLRSSIDVQNKAVVDMSAKNHSLERSLVLAGEQNKKITERTSTLIKIIKSSAVPLDCIGAVNHLNKFTSDFAEEWNK